METLAIVGGIVVLVGGGILLARWHRSDKHENDMARFDERLKARDELRALELRQIEHRFKALEQGQNQLRSRYHKMRGLLLRCLVMLGIAKREHDDSEDDDLENNKGE